MFVIDTNKEAIAIAEARKLHMPVVAIVDSNSDPEGISHPIPGNDDAGRAITLYCDLIARAAIDGIERAQGAAGADLGAAEMPLGEAALEEEEEETGADAGRKKRTGPGDDRKPPRRRPARTEGRGPGGARSRPQGGKPPRKPKAESPSGEAGAEDKGS
jgi:small subunit ribosomal protein S2